MISTTEIKNEIQLILRDYKHTMTKDLEQALENLHDDIESDKDNFVDFVEFSLEHTGKDFRLQI